MYLTLTLNFVFKRQIYKLSLDTMSELTHNINCVNSLYIRISNMCIDHLLGQAFIPSACWHST